MADINIPNLGSLTSADSTDLLEIFDVSANTNKRVTVDGLTPTNSITAQKLAANAITLGKASITANFTTTSLTTVQVTGLSVTVAIPAGGRDVKITAYTSYLYNGSSGNTATMEIWDGPVVSGTLLTRAVSYGAATNTGSSATAVAVVTPSAGSKTYNVGLRSSTAGGAGIEAGANFRAFILVEAI